MKRLAPILLASALALGGCAKTYENRIRSSLVEAGLAPPLASCMANRMVAKLSEPQLLSLGRLAGDVKRRGQDMTLPQFLAEYGPRLDPKVAAVLARAGLGCAIAG